MHLVRNPSRLATLRADQFYIGDVKRRLALDNAELRIDVAGAALMLFDQVDPGNHHAVAIGLRLASLAAFAPLARDHTLHFTLAAGVVTRDHHYLAVSYTHLRAHETRHDLVCRLLLE